MLSLFLFLFFILLSCASIRCLISSSDFGCMDFAFLILGKSPGESYLSLEVEGKSASDTLRPSFLHASTHMLDTMWTPILFPRL